MKQARAKSFIRAYEEAGLLPAGSHLVKGGGGSIPRQFTIWASETDSTLESALNLVLGVDKVKIGWFSSVAELVATVASAVQLDVHDAVANANFYAGPYRFPYLMYRAKREELDAAYKSAPLHQTGEELTVNGVERLCGCPSCGHSYDDTTQSFIDQMRATRS